MSGWSASAPPVAARRVPRARLAPRGATVGVAGVRRRKGSAMQTETQGVGGAKADSKVRRDPRGVFEKGPGSGVWWIRYADAMGRIRREKAGTKRAGLMLYRKRKT